MKKIFALILAMALCISLVACGGETKEPQNENNDTSITESKNDETESTNKEETKDSVELSLTYKVPMKNVYVDAPNYQEIEEGYTELFIVHESKYVAITSDRKSIAASVKDAHEIAFNKFKTNMQNYEGGVNGISIVKEETKQINGIEVYSFEGKINYGKDNVYDGYAKGYAFILDGVPCEIIGSVIDDSQSDALINEISAVVDAMIKTAREEA